MSGSARGEQPEPTGPPVAEIYPGEVGAGLDLQRKAAYAFRRDCRQDVSLHLAFRAAVGDPDTGVLDQTREALDAQVEADSWSAAQHAHQVLVIRSKRSTETQPREAIVPGLSDQEAWDAAAPVRRELELLAELRSQLEQATASGHAAQDSSEFADLAEAVRAKEERCARLDQVDRPIGVKG